VSHKGFAKTKIFLHRDLEEHLWEKHKELVPRTYITCAIDNFVANKISKKCMQDHYGCAGLLLASLKETLFHWVLARSLANHPPERCMVGGRIDRKTISDWVLLRSRANHGD
jgi:hypothetical protein